MRKINLAIALHFHQPIGNFEHIFERAYEFCYKPFMELLSNYPEVKMMFHISGCLLDYLEEKHPDAIKLIGSMVKRGQIEIMGGAYYEAILTAIPMEDAINQIKMMSGYINRRFKVTPRGIWAAERVWEPDISGLLHKAKARYLILDDEHLTRSGVKEDDVHGYFLTGSAKKKIAVFPSNKKLRYLIPFKPVGEVTDYLRSLAVSGKELLLTYGDDGEKFGEWPGTHAHVYGNRWLNNFFDMLMENKDWIELVHFSEYLKKHNPQADLIINQGSYKEMMEWSGDRWSNFLLKYPEAGQMHKKMLYVSSKLEKAGKKTKGVKIKGLEDARRHLYKGQCNCAYWHGVFGGLYLYHLRKGVYDHLIEADKLIDNVINKSKKGWLEVQRPDTDSGGRKEAVIENKDFSIYVSPFEGGVIKELDYRPLSFNLLNTLSRKMEPYHEKIREKAGQAGDNEISTIHDDFRKVDAPLKNMLIYDKFNRCSLRSYFVKDGFALSDLMNSSDKEVGDFSKLDYNVSGEEGGIILESKSIIENSPVRLRKRIRIESENEIKFIFSIKKEKNIRQKLLFGLEFNVTMPELDSDRYFYQADAQSRGHLKRKGHVSRVSSFGISDSRDEFGIKFCFSKKPSRVLYFPVQTISQSERAYELNYQCSCVFSLWDIDLKSDTEQCFDIRLVME
ncbi:MAG: alpha-amylase/4-alpha-glucanotransferase domain-containing protein [Candidatus Omnitrophota bacterium]